MTERCCTAGPQAAKFGRVVPKTQVLRARHRVAPRCASSSSTRSSASRWAYKLAEEYDPPARQTRRARDPGLRQSTQGRRRQRRRARRHRQGGALPDHLRDQPRQDGASAARDGRRLQATLRRRAEARRLLPTELAARTTPTASPLPAALDLPGLYAATAGTAAAHRGAPGERCRTRPTEWTRPQARTRDRRAREEAPHRAAAQPQGRARGAASRPQQQRSPTLHSTPAAPSRPRNDVDKLKHALARPDGSEHRQDRRTVPDGRSPRACDDDGNPSAAIDFDAAPPGTLRPRRRGAAGALPARLARQARRRVRRERADREDAASGARGVGRLRHDEEPLHRGRQPRRAEAASGVVPRQGQADLHRPALQHGQRLRLRRRLRRVERRATSSVPARSRRDGRPRSSRTPRRTAASTPTG